MNTTNPPTGYVYKYPCNAIDSKNKKLYYEPVHPSNLGVIMGAGVVSFSSIISACVILSIAMTMSDGQTRNTLMYVAGAIFIIATIMSVYQTLWGDGDTYIYDCEDDNRKDNEYRRI
jgi:hypothetical protein